VASDFPAYMVGSQGVNLTATPIHAPDGGLLTGQNVEYVRVQGLGGIGSRGGLAKLPGVTALGAQILALANLPFSFPGATDLMVSLNAAETNSFEFSTDGSSFSALTSGQLQRGQSVADLAGIAVSLTPGNFFFNQRAIGLGNKLYYAGSDYTIATTAPVLVVWTSGVSFELLRIPTNPTSGATVPQFISDIIVDNGLIYLAVMDLGGVAPNVKGRVMSFDPQAGLLSLVGNNFGNGSGENTGGYPTALCFWLGRLFVGCNGIAGSPAGVIYSILPGIEATWTLEKTFSAGDGYPLSMAVFNGELYVGMAVDSSGTATIRKRTSTGTWSTSLTAPSSNISYYGGLTAFNGGLWAVWVKNGSSTLVKRFNGSSWSTDLDVGATYSIVTCGTPAIYGGNLYIGCYNPVGVAAKTGFVLKRTPDPAGAWSQLLTTTGILGLLGSFQPESN
jgi:hypothetical protein